MSVGLRTERLPDPHANLGNCRLHGRSTQINPGDW